MSSFNSSWLTNSPNAYPPLTDNTDKTPYQPDSDHLSVLSVSRPKAFQLREAELIWSQIHQRAWILIYSKVLGEPIYWVYGLEDLKGCQEAHPLAVIYTLDELKALARARVTQEGLKKIHLSKKMMGGTLAPSTGLDPNPVK